MPLNLPQVSDAVAAPLSVLVESVEDDEITCALIDASLEGTESVENKLHELISQPLENAGLDDQ
jgi:hypothetical protein